MSRNDQDSKTAIDNSTNKSYKISEDPVLGNNIYPNIDINNASYLNPTANFMNKINQQDS